MWRVSARNSERSFRERARACDPVPATECGGFVRGERSDSFVERFRRIFIASRSHHGGQCSRAQSPALARKRTRTDETSSARQRAPAAAIRSKDRDSPTNPCAGERTLMGRTAGAPYLIRSAIPIPANEGGRLFNPLRPLRRDSCFRRRRVPAAVRAGAARAPRSFSAVRSATRARAVSRGSRRVARAARRGR